MAKLNYWTDKWDLHVDICPCDVHVNDWLADAEDDEQADLPLRHRHASRGRQGAGGERLRQHGVRHHRVDRGVRGLRQAGAGELARGEELRRLFRRHLSHQSKTAAGLRRGDDGAPVRVLLPEHDQRRIRRHRRPRRARSLHREDQAGRAHPVLHKVDRLRESRSRSSRQWEKEAPVTSVGEFKTLAVYRKD